MPEEVCRETHLQASVLEKPKRIFIKRVGGVRQLRQELHTFHAIKLSVRAHTACVGTHITEEQRMNVYTGEIGGQTATGQEAACHTP
jgi:hypothetical protein